MDHIIITIIEELSTVNVTVPTKGIHTVFKGTQKVVDNFTTVSEVLSVIGPSLSNGSFGLIVDTLKLCVLKHSYHVYNTYTINLSKIFQIN